MRLDSIVLVVSAGLGLSGCGNRLADHKRRNRSQSPPGSVNKAIAPSEDEEDIPQAPLSELGQSRLEACVEGLSPTLVSVSQAGPDIDSALESYSYACGTYAVYGVPITGMRQYIDKPTFAASLARDLFEPKKSLVEQILAVPETFRSLEVSDDDAPAAMEELLAPIRDNPDSDFFEADMEQLRVFANSNPSLHREPFRFQGDSERLFWFNVPRIRGNLERGQPDHIDSCIADKFKTHFTYYAHLLVHDTDTASYWNLVRDAVECSALELGTVRKPSSWSITKLPPKDRPGFIPIFQAAADSIERRYRSLIALKRLIREVHQRYINAEHDDEESSARQIREWLEELSHSYRTIYEEPSAIERLDRWIASPEDLLPRHSDSMELPLPRAEEPSQESDTLLNTYFPRVTLMYRTA